MIKSNTVKASDHESYNTLTVVSFLLPIVGIILGIVYLTKTTPEERKLGEHLVAFSIFAAIVQGILYVMFVPQMFMYRVFP